MLKKLENISPTKFFYSIYHDLQKISYRFMINTIVYIKSNFALCILLLRKMFVIDRKEEKSFYARFPPSGAQRVLAPLDICYMC